MKRSQFTYKIISALVLTLLFLNVVNATLAIDPTSKAENIKFQSVANTRYNIIDLEYLQTNSKIFICEGEPKEGRGHVSSAVKNNGSWQYTSLHENNSNWFQQLEIRHDSANLENYDVVFAHGRGVSLLSQNTSDSWQVTEIFNPGYTRSWDLQVADINQSNLGKEIVYTYETELFDIGNTVEITKDVDEWEPRLIYTDNPVPMQYCAGDFNLSHPGNEMISVNEGGFVRLLQKLNGSWQSVKRWDLGNYRVTNAIVADFDTSTDQMEFAVSYGTMGQLHVRIYGYINGEWASHTIDLNANYTDPTFITDMESITWPDSSTPSILCTDSNGTVWLITKSNDTWFWSAQQIWHDTNSLNAMEVIDSAIFVGGASRQLYVYYYKPITETETEGPPRSSSFITSPLVFCIAMIVFVKVKKVLIS